MPFKTIVRAARAAIPGTTVHVAPGSYPGGFQTGASGSAAARIAYVSSVRWGARIVPPARSTNSTAWDNRGSHVDIVGFEVDGSAERAGVAWLHGIYNGGSYVTIRANHVHHIALASPCESGGGSAIGVDAYYHGVHGDVIGNSVHDIGPAGCKYVQGIYMSTSGSVKNNLVYRIAAAGIHLWHDAHRVVIANNTVASSHTGIIVGSGDFYFRSGPADHVAVYNNIVYDNDAGISEQGATGPHNSYRNNLVVHNGIDWALKNGLVASATVNEEPRFVGYARSGSPDFHLADGSPAIGRGAVADSAAVDFDGHQRTGRNGVDIGAYQH